MSLQPFFVNFLNPILKYPLCWILINQLKDVIHEEITYFLISSFFLKRHSHWVISSFKNISIAPLYSIREFSLFGLFDILKYFLIGIHYIQG